MSPNDAFVVLYRWKIRDGFEEQFAEAWSAITLHYLNECRSLGSRLHMGDDGIWYAYAQWPNARARKEAFTGAVLDSKWEAMTDAIEERLPEVVLEIVSDHLKAIPM